MVLLHRVVLQMGGSGTPAASLLCPVRGPTSSLTSQPGGTPRHPGTPSLCRAPPARAEPVKPGWDWVWKGSSGHTPSAPPTEAPPSSHLSQVELEDIADVVRGGLGQLHQLLPILKRLAELLHTGLDTIDSVDALSETQKRGWGEESCSSACLQELGAAGSFCAGVTQSHLGTFPPAQTFLSFLFHRKEGGKRSGCPSSEFGVSEPNLSPGTFCTPESDSRVCGFCAEAQDGFRRSSRAVERGRESASPWFSVLASRSQQRTS